MAPPGRKAEHGIEGGDAVNVTVGYLEIVRARLEVLFGHKVPGIVVLQFVKYVKNIVELRFELFYYGFSIQCSSSSSRRFDNVFKDGVAAYDMLRHYLFCLFRIHIAVNHPGLSLFEDLYHRLLRSRAPFRRSVSP